MLTICDVGPRDGLQNESTILSVDDRLRLCRDLAEAGVRKVEAVSFVRFDRVPQMAGASELLESLMDTCPGPRWVSLVLNLRGLERAMAAGATEVRYAFPVTDAFCLRNQGVTVARAIAEAEAIAIRCRRARVRLGVYLSAAFGCPFEGSIAVSRVLDIAEQVIDRVDPDEIVLADTIGVAVPSQVRELIGGLSSRAGIGCHFHNTRNIGIANALVALEAGVDSIDSSIGGIGGCPFAPSATGNIATEDLVYMLNGMGVETGIDLDALITLTHWLGELLGVEPPSMVARAGNVALMSP